MPGVRSLAPKRKAPVAPTSSLMTPENWLNVTGTISRAMPRWRARSRVPPAWLVAAAVLSVALWLGAEFATRHPVHPRYACRDHRLRLVRRRQHRSHNGRGSARPAAGRHRLAERLDVGRHRP